MKDMHVCLSHDYGTNVRSGRITAELIFSQQKIENPKISEPDVVLILSHAKAREYKSARAISNEDFDFERISFKRFRSKRFANMIALGKLLKEIDIDVRKTDLKGILPARFYEKNTEALKEGYRIK